MHERKDFHFRFRCLNADGGPHPPLAEIESSRLKNVGRPPDENEPRRGYFVGRNLRGSRSQHPTVTDYLYAERFIPRPPLVTRTQPPCSKEFTVLQKQVTRCLSPKHQLTQCHSPKQQVTMSLPEQQETLYIPKQQVTRCLSPKQQATRCLFPKQQVTRCHSPKQKEKRYLPAQQETMYLPKQQVTRCHLDQQETQYFPKQRLLKCPAIQSLQIQELRSSPDSDEFSLLHDEVNLCPNNAEIGPSSALQTTRDSPQSCYFRPPRQPPIKLGVSNPSFCDGHRPSQNEGVDTLSPKYSRYFPHSDDPRQINMQGGHYYSTERGGFRPLLEPDTCQIGCRFSRYRDMQYAPQTETISLRPLSKKDARSQLNTRDKRVYADTLLQSVFRKHADKDTSLGYSGIGRPAKRKIDAGHCVFVDKPSATALDIGAQVKNQAHQLDESNDSCLSEGYETDSFYSTDIEFVSGPDKTKKETNFMRLLRKLKNAVCK